MKGELKDMVRGFLTVSLSDAEPAWQGRHEGGLRRAKGSRGTLKGREQCRNGRTKSIFRLQNYVSLVHAYIEKYKI
jgi:hypothetical protein